MGKKAAGAVRSGAAPSSPRRAAAPNAAASPPASGSGDSVAIFNEDSRKLLDRVIWAGVALAASALAAVGTTLTKDLQVSLVANGVICIVGFVATLSCIQTMAASFIAANLRGIDLNKPSTKRNADGALVRPVEGIAIPESMGTVCATVFILMMSVFIPFSLVGYELHEFPYVRLTEYLAALLTITLASYMGLADDVLDLRWRHKIPLPMIALLPLLFVYRIGGGQTGVMVPSQLRGVFGDYLDLGPLFYAALLVFAFVSTNAINIYAGVNGLEVGQSVVIAASALTLNIVQLYRIPDEYQEYREDHLKSVCIILPFLAVSLALLHLNWFPSRVFVGDAYCYFAGMTLAVVCIVGHYSKTMVLLQVPQLLNALISMPQLLRIIPIPRHRMPVYNAKTGCVENSFVEVRVAELSFPGKAAFHLLCTLRLVRIVPLSEGCVKMSNLTVINVVLHLLGPCREDVLCLRLLTFQAVCSCICFAVRFGLASYVFEKVL